MMIAVVVCAISIASLKSLSGMEEVEPAPVPQHFWVVQNASRPFGKEERKQTQK